MCVQFALVAGIALANVLLVWVGFGFVSVEPARSLEHFTPRKHFAAEQWTRDFSRCQVDDCQFVRNVCVDKSRPWTESDTRSCFSGLLVPHSARQCGAIPGAGDHLASCEMTPPVPFPAHCQGQEGPLRVYIPPSHQGEFLSDVERILYRDLSFTKGLGVAVVAGTERDHDVLLQSTREQKPRVSETFDASTCRTTISLRELGTRAKPQALYNAAIRSQLGEVIQRTRPRLTSSQLSIAVLLVWSGTKPAPHSLLKVAQSFVQSSPIFTILLLVDSAHHAYFEAHNPHPDKIKLVKLDDLGEFIHSRASELVPEVRNHTHYPLGWSLCDFRWLFGAIFQDYLPEEEYTHWAWADSDAYVSPDLFGPITDYGYDFVRHDVTSFAAMVYDKPNTASSMMGYASGTLTVVRNTAKGRELFRYTPLDRLIRGLVNPSNGILDEAITSNAVLSAPNVTVALIASQVRAPGTVRCRKTGKMFYIARDWEDSTWLDKLRVLGRVNTDPHAAASVSDSKARVLGRFVGGKALGGQFESPGYAYLYPAWYTPPLVSPDSFLSLESDGVGFSSLLRDEQGNWFARPLPRFCFHRSNKRSFPDHVFYLDRALVRVEVAVTHSRIAGGACEVHDASVFDFTNSNRSTLLASPFVDPTAPECRPFRGFFH